MKPEAQRIAIAEACGWRMVEGIRAFPSIEWVKARVPEEVFKELLCVDHMEVPDYFNDINACQVFVDVLRKRGRDDLDRYYRCLAELCYQQRPEPEFFSLVYIAHATAAQRAEAFLRTIGKWEEPTP